jgi:hypothetical protein
MTNIQNKIETAIYGYDPNVFLPIFEGGKLSNRNQFIAYKTKKALYKAFESTVLILDEIYQAAHK